MSGVVDVALRLERARAAEGLSYGDPAKRAAYCQHQYPGDSPPAAAQLGRSQSGCLLHLRSLLHAEGLDDDVQLRGHLVDSLDGPYAEQVGLVEALLRAWVDQRGGGALRYQGPDAPVLRPGELVVIGSGMSTHGLCVLSVDGDQVTSSDGGQTDPRNGGLPTAIAERTRTLARTAAGVWTLGGRALSWGWY